MSIREVVETELEHLLAEEGVEIPNFDNSLALLDSGLDSLGFAVLVTRLDDKLGYDPFTLMSEAVYPSTLGQFVEIYERFASSK